MDNMQKKRLLKKTEERLAALVEEIHNFAGGNNISLEEAFDIKLIDDLRGLSHSLYNGFSPLRKKT